MARVSLGDLEIFHKALKSGCQPEQSKLIAAERLPNLLAMFCSLGWRLFWLLMLNRSIRRAAATVVLAVLET